MVRRAELIGGVLRIVLALSLAACAGLASGASDCPSPEACLARALRDQWAAYYGYIESAWTAYRDDRALYAQAAALGDPQIVALAQERLAASERVWKHAQALGEAVADPTFGAYLDARVRRADAALDAARARKQTQQRMLDAYQRSSGRAREAALRDIMDYADEADRMVHVQALDSVMTAVSGMNEYALSLAESGKLGRLGEGARKASETIVVAGHTVESGLEAREAVHHDDLKRAALEAGGAVGKLVLTAARIVKAGELATVGGAEVYAGLLGVTLDATLLVQNLALIEEARQRTLEADLAAQRFSARVLKADIEARRIERLRDAAQAQVAQRARITGLLERIRREEP